MRVLTHFVLWSLGMAAAETQTTRAERQSLSAYAAGKKRLVEIGVWHGVTTCILRQAMAPDGELLAIDPYPVGRLGFNAQAHIAFREVSKVPNGTIRWMRCTGAEAAKQISTTRKWHADFIFIDGEHSYGGLQADWEAWSGLIVPKGIVALHDSCSSESRNIEEAGSVRFTREIVLQDPRFELKNVVDTLTVLGRLS